MNLNPKIKLLADYPEHIPALAELWLQELGKKWVPDASAETAEKKFHEHLNKNKLPLTFIALEDDLPVGMASLRVTDGIRPELTPWLGGVIVHPDYRHHGIGEMLIHVVENQARKMGYDKLYLLAFDDTIPNWYAKLGWYYLGMDKLFQHPVTVMETSLA